MGKQVRDTKQNHFFKDFIFLKTSLFTVTFLNPFLHTFLLFCIMRVFVQDGVKNDRYYAKTILLLRLPSGQVACLPYSQHGLPWR